MQFNRRGFYLFSGAHSLLIGMLPFFLPVLLWERGASLSEVSAFIALSGLGFIAALWCWDRLRDQQRWGAIIGLSLVVEIVLVAMLMAGFSSIELVLLAFLNGTYNCFYWSTQRAMFSKITHETNTGKTFGNFQILVVVLLKIGILAGGYLLESQNVLILLLLSVAISGVAFFKLVPLVKITLGKSTHTSSKLAQTSKEPALKLSDIAEFKDLNHSRLTFLLDGPFLYLESYFWVLTLYFLTQQNFFKLGLLVVSLTLLLSVIFYFLKNYIDRIPQKPLFSLAVLLYAVSWWLRGQLNLQSSELALYPMIILIAFLTTFFRLAFNKRFFDVAKQTMTYKYIILKSYYSQASIVLFFGFIAGLLWFAQAEDAAQSLSWVYVLTCPIALFYGLYTCPTFSSQPSLAIKNSENHRLFRS